jgi:PEP-CTERM motif
MIHSNKAFTAAAMALAMALSLVTPAQASLTMSTTLSNLSLAITDASGFTKTFPGDLLLTGDPLFATRLGGVDVFGNDGFSIFTKGNNDLTSLGATDAMNLQANAGTMQLNALNTGNGFTLTSSFQSAAPAPATTEGRQVIVGLSGGLVPAVQVDQDVRNDDLELAGVELTGGFWLAPGSTATLSGTAKMDSTWRLDDELVPTSRLSGYVNTNVAITLTKGNANQYFQDATLIDGNQATAQLDWTELSFGEAGAPLSRQTNQQDDLLITLSNLTSQGQWVLLSATSSATQTLSIAPGPIPEPSTLALQALGLAGLVGVVASRQRPQRKAA